MPASESPHGHPTQSRACAARWRRAGAIFPNGVRMHELLPPWMQQLHLIAMQAGSPPSPSRSARLPCSSLLPLPRLCPLPLLECVPFMLREASPSLRTPFPLHTARPIAPPIRRRAPCLSARLHTRAVPPCRCHRASATVPVPPQDVVEAAAARGDGPALRQLLALELRCRAVRAVPVSHAPPRPVRRYRRDASASARQARLARACGRPHAPSGGAVRALCCVVRCGGAVSSQQAVLRRRLARCASPRACAEAGSAARALARWL